MLSCLRARGIIEPSTTSQNQKDIQKVLECNNLSLADLDDCLETLRSWKADDATVESFKSSARKSWPEASILHTAKQQD
jgi:hypothetical protein